jgi:hypothetical protein
MTLIESSVFLGPTVTSPTGSEQSGIIIADNNGLIDPSLRQAIAPERTSGTVLRLRIEKAAVLNRPRGPQNMAGGAFQNIVLGIVSKATEWHARPDWLRLCWDQCVNIAPLEGTVYLRVGIASISRDTILMSSPVVASTSSNCGSIISPSFV